ncbi:MAG: TonB-dependent receptor plug domain-containing protein, partial [Bacteroidota bacterium]
MQRFWSFWLFICFAPLLDAQENLLLSFNFQDVELVGALEELESNYDITFSFSDQLLRGERVTSRARSLQLEAALQKMLSQTSIDFRIVRDRYVLLLAKKDTESLSELPPDDEADLSPFSLQGRVVDEQSGQGLPFAQLRIENRDMGGYTDAEGHFDLDIRGLPEDVVEVTSLGYGAKSFTVAELASSSHRISMSWSSVGLADVVVTEYLTDGIQTGEELGQIQFSPPRMDLLPGQAEPDVLQGLLLLPGVSSPTESVSDINIRGGTADQNLVLWDGIPIYHTGHYFGSFTAFNPFVVDQVNVWRGGFGAQYSGRVAGVVDIQTSNEVATDLRAGAGFNLTHGHAFVELPIVSDKLSVMFSVRRAFTDIIPSITFDRFRAKVFQGTKADEEEGVINEENQVLEDNFFFVDAHSKLLWEPSERDKVSLSYFTGKNELEFALGEPGFRITDNLNIRNRGARVSWEHRWSAEWATQVEGSYSYFDFSSALVEQADNVFTVLQSEKSNALTDRRLSAILRWNSS